MKKKKKLTSVNSADAGKFFNQKNLNKSSNNYMGPIIQAFLSFFSLFRMRRVYIYCLCIPLSVFINFSSYVAAACWRNTPSVYTFHAIWSSFIFFFSLLIIYLFFTCIFSPMAILFEYLRSYMTLSISVIPHPDLNSRSQVDENEYLPLQPTM